jgi:predicted lipid-binding transport protein (Tim44 family)
MNKFLMVLTTVLAFGMSAFDAEAAKRLGGGGNVGAQRNMTAQPPAKTPAQQAQPAAPAAPTPAPQPSGMSRWLGPLAGLAIGAGLASMFMNAGMGAGLASAMGGILMIALLAGAALFAWRMLRGKPAGNNNLQYAGANAGAAAPYAPAPAATPATAGGMPQIGSALGGAAAAPAVEASRFPPGFDAEQFARHAKMNFTRLQQANDKRDVSTMRDYMTPQLYTAITAELDPMGVAQNTEIISLDAAVVEVVTENNMHIASVRFTGSLRDRADPAPETFDEIWHLEKPLDGSSGWLISGIQQV